ncbi:hypothetical protein G3580_03415 [Nitrogeniibacter mangrovi]|uniref:Polysaccharide polymerase n=1 Tax=Nitrogeniibacter mangrovi TaxID=2016596 RepID=A0A6C1AZI4_9RHOO|nr:hypothetical protein [Nitrogeniibacter mangrovi]QID16766.1 hypothetical protein G3580_03415 [Nitrogeniibacter mangrovi]
MFAAFVVVLTVLVFALLIGAALTVLGWKLGVILCFAIAAPIYLAAFWKNYDAAADLFFLGMLGIVFGTEVLASLAGLKLSFLTELFLFSALPLVAVRAASGRLRFDGIKPVFLPLGAYFVIALVSSVYGFSTLLGVFFQLLTTIKPFLLILLGAAITGHERFERILLFVVANLWKILLPLVVLQLISPAAFSSVFHDAAVSARNDLLGTTRAVGFFRHASYLGSYAGLFSLISVTAFLWKKRKSYLVASAVYLFLMIASGERNETVAGVAGLAMLPLVLGPREGMGKRALLSVVVMTVLTFSAFLFFQDYILGEAEKMNLVGNGRVFQPRSVLYYDGFRLANQYFPLGSGLGTFGSAAAAKFNWAVYDMLGFRGFSWYGTNVLNDTYWPQFFAEAGWIGFSFYFISFVAVFVSLVRALRSATSSRELFFSRSAYLAFIFCAAISVASPIFEDPGLFLIPGALIGYALMQRGRRGTRLETMARSELVRPLRGDGAMS